MTSLRIPKDLLERMHQATPRGMPLHRALQRALEMAGGPAAVHDDLRQADRRERARAQVARLRRMGHRSVVLDPDHQVTLVGAAAAWCALLEEEGRRRWDPQARRLVLAEAPEGLDGGPGEGRRLAEDPVAFRRDPGRFLG